VANNGISDKSHFTTRNKLDEFYRLNFLQSEKGVWLAQFDRPMPIELPIEQQEEHLMKHAYLSDCNSAFVKMYGYEDPKEMIGVRFPQLFDNSEIANLENLRLFLKDGYQIRNAETVEIGRNGIQKHFLNDIVGIVENNYLIRVWGAQQDITEEKSRIESEKQLLKQLTPEQLQIFKMTVEGKTMKEIASVVGISIKSVESLRNQIKAIVGVDTIAQLIATAIQLGIQKIEI
jgi:DNA-binding CsgD family transcriptional regulator